MHSFLRDPWIGCDAHEKLIEAVGRPGVRLNGEGAAVWENDVGLDLSALALPGEGIEKFADIEDPALDSELAAHEGEIADSVIPGEIDGNGDPPCPDFGLGHGAGSDEVAFDLVDPVGIGDGDELAFFGEGEKTPETARGEVDGGRLHEDDLVSRFDEFIDEKFEILGEVNADGGVPVIFEDLRREG